MLRTTLAAALLLTSALAARPVSAQRLEIDVGSIGGASFDLAPLRLAQDLETERLRAEILEIDTTPHVVATVLGLGGFLGGLGLAMGGYIASCDESNMGLLPGCDGPAALVAGGAFLGVAGLVTLIIGITSWHDASVRRSELRRALEQRSSLRVDGNSIALVF